MMPGFRPPQRVTAKPRTKARLAALVTTAIAATGLAGGIVLAAPGPAQASDGCTYGSPFTPRSTSLFGRLIELRANTSEVCAWGRISNGSVGDQVWVDRSTDGGNTWQQLSITTITSGRSVFTDNFNDQAKLMRACGKAGDRVEVACTSWW